MHVKNIFKKSKKNIKYSSLFEKLCYNQIKYKFLNK